MAASKLDFDATSCAGVMPSISSGNSAMVEAGFSLTLTIDHPSSIAMVVQYWPKKSID